MSNSKRRRRIPKYCHHKARNLARVTIDGKDHYLGEYNSPESKERYRELVGQWLDRQQDEILDTKVDVRICELMVFYVGHCTEYYRKDGKLTREYGCITEALKILRNLYDLEMVNGFGPKSLKAVRNSMIELGWSRKYINKQIGRVVRLFKWGVGEQLVRPGTWHALQAVEGLKKGRTEAPDLDPVEPVCNAVVDATLPHLSDIVADMVRIQRLTGGRPSEICLFRPQDIDRSGDVWRYVPAAHKTEHQHKARIVWIGPQAQAILKKYLLRPESEYCFDPREAPNDLGNEIAKLAEGLNLDFDDAIREALENWVERVRRTQSRLPDEPILDASLNAPCDLPRSTSFDVASREVALTVIHRGRI